jgi:circadian clock protein KaiB
MNRHDKEPSSEDPTQIKNATSVFDGAIERQEQQYLLRLYVAGTSSLSRQAIANIRRVCEEKLAGRYDLEVVDIYQAPERAKEDNIVAVPTLVKQLPSPLRKLIGTLSDHERILVGLDLRPKPIARTEENGEPRQ